MQGPTDSHMLTVKDRTRPRLSGSMSTTCSSHGCPSGVATARPTCDHLSGCHPGLSSRAIPHTIVRLATCRIKPAGTKLSTNSKTDHADRITETAEPQTPCRVPRPPNTPNAWDEEQPHSFARSGASSCLAGAVGRTTRQNRGCSRRKRRLLTASTTSCRLRSFPMFQMAMSWSHRRARH